MLDDSAGSVEPKDVNARPRTVAWPFLETVQDDVLSLGNNPFEMDTLPGVLAMRVKYSMKACLPSATIGLC